MRRLARIFWAYRTGKATVPQLPVRLWIESTSRCNLKCGYCPNKDVAKEDHGFMDFGLFTSIIDQNVNLPIHERPHPPQEMQQHDAGAISRC